MPFPLPAHIQGNAPAELDQRLAPGRLDHPGLAYYRYVPGGLADDQKAGFLRQLRDRFNAPGERPWKAAAEQAATRLHAAANALHEQGRPVAAFRATTATRLLVGMGAKNALEVGLTFHHPGGFPYLPGSSVKGLCRAWAEQVKAPDPADAAGLVAHREELKRIFGSASKDEQAEAGAMEAGSVCFLDALPERFPALDVDLMNPHFALWYGEGEAPEIPPGDWQEPVIIPFLAVAPEQAFRFTLVGRTAEATSDVETARGWLVDALQELGAGGKTAAGYGYFTAVEPLTE